MKGVYVIVGDTTFHDMDMHFIVYIRDRSKTNDNSILLVCCFVDCLREVFR